MSKQKREERKQQEMYEPYVKILSCPVFVAQISPWPLIGSHRMQFKLMQFVSRFWSSSRSSGKYSFVLSRNMRAIVHLSFGVVDTRRDARPTTKCLPRGDSETETAFCSKLVMQRHCPRFSHFKLKTPENNQSNKIKMKAYTTIHLKLTNGSEF